ncbi:DUF4198 domain-containing protein [Erythrobacter sp. T5W1-R]|uniref:DUF4198 domain-containing protein n=1 Tax=Erythrobacter sp. T5W1-R TaxID=3101752 RepID=UPI002AFFD658|nr:DUF4198 domain-containing protein [Erythrobacter sp. T5W1-R]MEA1618609.1 DUF4198 domain-containing protein [Erythrobacter sp. T5W1-R]
MIRKTVLLAAAFGMATSAAAHNAWLLPSNTVLSDLGQSVTVDAGASTAPFEADHAALPAATVKVWAPDGTMGTIENAARLRYRSTFDVRVDKPGTWRIGMENRAVTGSFTLEGEKWTVGRRRGPAPAPGAPVRNIATVDELPEGATDLDLTEVLGRNEFFVTAGEPTETLFATTGKGLEFVPVTFPTDLVADEPAQFRFMVDGKAAAGLEVEIIPGGRRYRSDHQSIKLATDADGLLTVNWPGAGFYWLNATLTDAKAAHPGAAKRRMSYTATLEVLAP